MRYLGKSHNLWYRMALSLEQMALDSGSLHMIRPKKEATDMYDFEPSTSTKEVGRRPLARLQRPLLQG